MTYQCPSCGANVRFTSRVSVFTVCEYCRSTLLRQDLKLEHLGEMAVLQEDASPLQLGSSGKYQGASFTLIGRAQITWRDGRWNEWFMYFDGVREGWLAEAQGFYMVSFEKPDIKQIPALDTLQPGGQLTLEGQAFTVQDIKECSISYSEGELPFKAVYGVRSTSVDLGGEDGAFSCIDYSEEGTQVYVGQYQSFNDLHFSSLREFDGW